jgi:hypothetical protein
MPAAPSLALCLLLLGLGYALPFAALPTSNLLNDFRAAEISNLYALVAWMGLAHFVFAFKYQGLSLIRKGLSKRGLFFTLVSIVILAILIVLRNITGMTLFNTLTWVYFIPHFTKAELFFYQRTKGETNKVLYLFPTLAFVYFSIAIFLRNWFVQYPWLLFALAFVVIFVCIPFGLIRSLQEKTTASLSLIGFFLIAEALLWGTYSKYMVATFADGVYTFHVAAASFYHYFRSYHFGALGETNKTRYWSEVFIVNLLVMTLGYIILHFVAVPGLTYLFDPFWFTTWVALHLICSDVFPFFRR